MANILVRHKNEQECSFYDQFSFSLIFNKALKNPQGLLYLVGLMKN